MCLRSVSISKLECGQGLILTILSISYQYKQTSCVINKTCKIGLTNWVCSNKLLHMSLSSVYTSNYVFPANFCTGNDPDFFRYPEHLPENSQAKALSRDEEDRWSQTLPAYPQIRETLILSVQSIKLGLEIIFIYPFFLVRMEKKLQKVKEIKQYKFVTHYTLKLLDICVDKCYVRQISATKACLMFLYCCDMLF